MRGGRFERPVQRERLPRHLLADLAGVVAPLDLKVDAEEVDDRQVRRRFPVGDGARLEDQPSFGAVGAGELPVEAGLSDTGLADDRHDLPVARSSQLQGLGQLHDLLGAADELRQAAGRRRLETRAHSAGAGELVHVDRLAQSFDRPGPQRVHGDETLGEPQSIRGDQDRKSVV